MQLSNLYDGSKTKLHGKMNSINTPIFRVFLCESSMGTCKSRAHRSRGHHYITGEESLKSDNCTKSKWFFYIKRIVNEIVFSYIWINQANERNCKQSIAKTFLQRLKDIYSQNARYINKDENTDSGKMQFLRKNKR